MSFTKLFSSLTASTIWNAPDHTRLVWITMLAMADRDGYVGASVPGLAVLARVPIESVIIALESFTSPDQWSRTKDHDGRRIEEVDGGWSLLNYDKYRATKSPDDVREKTAARVRRYRENKKQQSNTGNVTVTRVTQSNPIADAEADAEAEKSKPTCASATPNARTRRLTPFVSEIQQRSFEEFWRFYWRKTAKKTAEKAYSAKVLSVASHKTVMEALSAQSAAMLGRDPEKRPHAATWLNQERWSDEADPAISAVSDPLSRKRLEYVPLDPRLGVKAK